jgi:hypothetical protein
MSKERKVKFSDDETSSDESADLSNDDLAEYSDPANGQVTRQVKFSDDESSIESDDHSKEEESDEFQVEKFESKSKEMTKSLKPLVFENKSSKMEIKQLNLDELNDLSEIPISNKEAAAISDDEENFREENGGMNIVPISSDPFFLDKNGREIYNSSFDYNLRETDTRSSFKYNNNRFNDNNKETFRNKRDSLNSSYKTSLSSSIPPNQSSSFSNRSRNYNENRNRSFNNNYGNNQYRNAAFPIPRDPSFRSKFSDRGLLVFCFFFK